MDSNTSLTIMVVAIAFMIVLLIYNFISAYWLTIKDVSYETWKKLHLKYKADVPWFIRPIMWILLHIGI